MSRCAARKRRRCSRLASSASQPTIARPPRVRRVLRSFGYAAEGLVSMVRTQPNFVMHLGAAVGVLAVALALRVSAIEAAVLILTIAFVLVLECVNTALETLCDLVSPAYHPLVKRAKDVSAAGVLVGAAAAVLIGALVLGPHLAAVV